MDRQEAEKEAKRRWGEVGVTMRFRQGSEDPWIHRVGKYVGSKAYDNFVSLGEGYTWEEAFENSDLKP